MDTQNTDISVEQEREYSSLHASSVTPCLHGHQCTCTYRPEHDNVTVKLEENNTDDHDDGYDGCAPVIDNEFKLPPGDMCADKGWFNHVSINNELGAEKEAIGSAVPVKIERVERLSTESIEESSYHDGISYPEQETKPEDNLDCEPDACEIKRELYDTCDAEQDNWGIIGTDTGVSSGAFLPEGTRFTPSEDGTCDQDLAPGRHLFRKKIVSSSKQREFLNNSNNCRMKSEAIRMIKKQLQRLTSIPNITVLFAVKNEETTRRRRPFVFANGSLQAALYKSPDLIDELQLDVTGTSEESPMMHSSSGQSPPWDPNTIPELPRAKGCESISEPQKKNLLKMKMLPAFKDRTPELATELPKETTVIGSCEDLENFPQIKEKRSTLKKALHLYSLSIRGRTPKDGNCFFHAASDQLYYQNNCKITALDLRRAVVDFLITLPQNEQDALKPFVEGSWKRYIEQLVKSGTWADHVAILATARFLQMDIKIITSSNTHQLITVSCGKFSHRRPLLLGHFEESHYVSLQTEDGHQKKNQKRPAASDIFSEGPPEHKKSKASEIDDVDSNNDSVQYKVVRGDEASCILRDPCTDHEINCKNIISTGNDDDAGGDLVNSSFSNNDDTVCDIINAPVVFNDNMVIEDPDDGNGRKTLCGGLYQDSGDGGVLMGDTLDDIQDQESGGDGNSEILDQAGGDDRTKKENDKGVTGNELRSDEGDICCVCGLPGVHRHHTRSTRWDHLDTFIDIFGAVCAPHNNDDILPTDKLCRNCEKYLIEYRDTKSDRSKVNLIKRNSNGLTRNDNISKQGKKQKYRR